MGESLAVLFPGNENSIVCILTELLAETTVEKAARLKVHLELKPEREEVLRLDSTSVKPGQPWCIIDSVWLSHWREYAITGSRSDPPGPITNWQLMESGRPKPGLLRVKHYRGINLEVWQLLSRYGGGPMICRGTDQR